MIDCNVGKLECVITGAWHAEVYMEVSEYVSHIYFIHVSMFIVQLMINHIFVSQSSAIVLWHIQMWLYSKLVFYCYFLACVCVWVLCMHIYELFIVQTISFINCFMQLQESRVIGTSLIFFCALYCPVYIMIITRELESHLVYLILENI